MKRARTFTHLSLLLIFVILLTVSSATDAAWLCRSDPVVILSNGFTLDIGASISTLPMQVTEVHYELHVPAGVALVAAIGTPTWLTSQETFTVIADQPSRQYTVVTTVYTTEGDADVVADTTLISALQLRLGRYTVSGKEGNALSLSFRG